MPRHAIEVEEEELSSASVVVPQFLGFLSNQITDWYSDKKCLYSLVEKLDFTKQNFWNFYLFVI